MTYHFFEKWAERREDVLNFKREITKAKKTYMLKVYFFHKIWNQLNKNKIDRKSAEALARLYKLKSSNAYMQILAKSKELFEIKSIHSEEIYQFIDLVRTLNEKVEVEKKLAQEIIEELLSGKLPVKSKFYQLQEFFKEESLYLNIEDQNFKKIEEVFLIQKEPGAGTGGYILITEAVEKGMVTIEGKKIFTGKKPIQGLKIDHNKIIIKGDHFAPMQNARWIEGDQYVSPSSHDPYSYFVERGRFNSWPRRKIQYTLGISNAEAVVSLEVEVFPEQTYIKIKEEGIIQFAIAQLKPEQVRRVYQKAQLIA
ncbi:hypothetical protein COV12_02675 [Candidatus Woesearchaeota archaeon CG10_big_fil_rev_8_21_14_0_10_32_24]|nr:MAG: hypothetical protein COV12_02675 [Candidatus Woesearchaeota archaeon CG10_big_fil_rev_8_21_14_0_10_32_24]